MKTSNKPKPLPELSAKDIARFWNLVDRCGPDECWLWKGSTFRKGYGQFKVKSRNLKSHRIAFFLQSGSDPGELLTCHTCDTPRCCNGSHLFDGTTQDNALDCKAKGRLNTARGELHGSRTKPESRARGSRVAGAKLHPQEVADIRRSYDRGTTQQSLATMFGTSRENISRIIRGLNWKHIVAEDGLGNLSDKTRKGKRGEDSSQAVLTGDNVREIRRLVNEGVHRQALADRFCVTVGTIHHIIRRVTWKYL